MAHQQQHRKRKCKDHGYRNYKVIDETGEREIQECKFLLRAKMRVSNCGLPGGSSTVV
jgi:hypothetical protein